jgi:MFS family permease
LRDPRPAQTTTPNPWVALAILYVISAFSLADRFILSILAPAIKQDLRLSDFAVGLLVGPAIAVLYSVMCVPLGHYADRVNRVRFLSVCLAVWSVFTALGGLAVNAWQLAMTRLGVAAAEGGSSPSSISLIADYFPPERRALASAIHASATSVGMFLAFAVGGYVAQHFGWRSALVIIGLPGVVLAVVSIVWLREPRRGGHDGAAAQNRAPGSFLGNVRHIMAVKVFRETLLGTMFIYVATSVVTAWAPTFLLRKFGISAGVVGFNLGLGLAALGSACVLMSGWMINRIGLASFPRSLRVVASLQACGIAVLLLAILTPSFSVSLVALCVLYGLTSIYLPIQLSTVQNHLPANMRATGAALSSLVVVLVVQGVMPPLVGALSDWLQPQFGAQSLGYGMLVVVPAILLSALQYTRVATLIERS